MAQEDKVYEFAFKGGGHNVYRFSTVDGVNYEIKFVPSTDLFEADEPLEASIFEMIVSVVDNPRGRRLPIDRQVSPTIFAIFEHFFLPIQHVIVFICDSSDGREQARFRKFGQWFYKQANSTPIGELLKVDQTFADGDATIYLSLIVSRQHPQMRLIIDLFVQLGAEPK